VTRPVEPTKRPAASPPTGAITSAEAVVAPSTRLRSSSGTVSYTAVARIGLMTPQARPSTVIITASGVTVPVRAATAKRGAPTTANATTKSGHRRTRPPATP
jgi:hypothetical protein